jgi:predicted DNA-binding protein
MSVRVTSLRMPEGMADELALLARIAGEPISEIVRLAIEKEITHRRSDQLSGAAKEDP